MTFRFVVTYLGFLKHIPLLPHVFDAFLKTYYLLFHPRIIHYMDEVERMVSGWEGVSVSMHKFGGVQFNYHHKEIGHIHGNGLLDILFSREIKKNLLDEGRAQEHHVFKSSGWISFYLKDETDIDKAIGLLSDRLAAMKSNNVNSFSCN